MKAIKFFCIVLAIVLGCSFLNVNLLYVNALMINDDTSLMEEKSYCSATIEDEFSQDRIIVVLTNEASLQLKHYDQSDFTTF